jgi:hypothetical protein
MEGGWFDDEAIEQERWDADIEMAEMAAVGQRAAALRRAGICTHGSGVGYALNPRTGKVYYPEQEGLSGTQQRCTSGCGQVFADMDAMDAARREVLGM